ncbi:MAG: glycoside hydrolase family 65 protein, partial [Solirubrobacterales bacterium]|nr:glycoside hydrolase family 65 protein [Solirubrobacterales bacterium]
LFDVRYGELRSHERVLDFRSGVLRRSAEWVSPTGCAVRVASTRLVSFSQRAIAAILYEVEPLDKPIPVVVQSELVANESMPETAADPRAAAALASPLRSEAYSARDKRAVLTHSTNSSGLRIAVAMGHEIHGPQGAEYPIEAFADFARLTVSADLKPGQPLRLIKFLAYGWSSARSTSSLRAQVAAALSEAQHRGWDGLLAEQRAYLDEFWDRADVEVDGDAELQQAIRFGLFHTLQAGARAEQRAIAAKGLTGSGYDGHAFWDTETFVLPVLTYSMPQAAADALRWRHSTLDLARDRARQLGLKGAAFPWRTIGGQECSGYWPAGIAAFHVNADIADAVIRYCGACDDEPFEKDIGAELLIETARLWRSLGHHDAAGRFRIDGITGPDEYSAIADNNVYTNLMAQQNLRAGADAAIRYPETAIRLGVDAEETAGWRDAARTIVIAYDENHAVHAQAESFLEHDVWDFKSTSAEQYPLLLHFPYFELYRKQVVKQADLVLAMHLRGDAFSDEQKANNFAYYEGLTVRDSSLSACTQAVLATEVGHLELAYDYFAEAALVDLEDLNHNTRDGLHIASLAGAWIAAVAGFGGMRDHDGVLRFAPRLPQAIRRLAFRLYFRGQRLLVEIRHDGVRYTLVSGEALEIVHEGEALTLEADAPVVRPLVPLAERTAPTQPPGRAPARRQASR